MIIGWNLRNKGVKLLQIRDVRNASQSEALKKKDKSRKTRKEKTNSPYNRPAKECRGMFSFAYFIKTRKRIINIIID